MAGRRTVRFYALVALSVLLGLLLGVYPLAPDYSALRPELLCLLVIFWVINTSQYIGVTYAWSVGLVQDVVEGSVWGAHALALALVAYVCTVSYQRIKSYSVWHQALWVFVLVGLHQVVVNAFQGLAGYHTPPQYLLLSTVIAALCWPPMQLLLWRVLNFYRLR